MAYREIVYRYQYQSGKYDWHPEWRNGAVYESVADYERALDDNQLLHGWERIDDPNKEPLMRFCDLHYKTIENGLVVYRGLIELDDDELDE